MAPSTTIPAPSRTSSSEQLDVWSAPSCPNAPTSPPREQLERHLITIAKELARKAGDGGLTIDTLRTFAEARGILTGEERGRALSWLYLVPKRAGLVCTGQVRPSTRKKAHGNYQRVWVLPASEAGK